MKPKNRRYGIVFDVEFTAWEGSMQRRWSAPGEFTELVQIGAVSLDLDSFSVEKEFSVLVRPRINPMLSEYFVALTGITQERLNLSAVDFAVAYRMFLDFVGENRIAAFGRDDLIFAANFRLYGWEKKMPIPAYRNIVPWFAEQNIDLKGKHACHVAEAAGVAYAGRHHDALADAHSVALGIKALVERGAPSPFAGAEGWSG